MYMVNYKINIYFLRFIIWYRTRIMLRTKTRFWNQIGFFFYFSVILFYIIYILLLLYSTAERRNRFPLRRRWFVLPTNDHRRHRCVCAFAPRARSTWDRSVAVASVAVNLVKFPVARRRRRCHSAVHPTPPLPPPFPIYHHRHRTTTAAFTANQRFQTLSAATSYDKNGDEKLPTSFAVRISRTAFLFNDGVRSRYDGAYADDFFLILWHCRKYHKYNNIYNHVVSTHHLYDAIYTRRARISTRITYDIVRSAPMGGNTVRCVYVLIVVVGGGGGGMVRPFPNWKQWRQSYDASRFGTLYVALPSSIRTSDLLIFIAYSI